MSIRSDRISDRILHALNQSKMSYGDLSAKTGISKSVLQRYATKGTDKIPASCIEDIAKALHVRPHYLMGWESSATQQPKGCKQFPLLGEIACGTPIFADDSCMEYVTADEDLDADFCLRCEGDSMIGARILNGDIVFIRKQSMVNNGEIAAVIIGDSATLKRVYYYQKENKLVLSPENPKYAPFVYVGDELEQIHILGKAVAFQSSID